MMKVKAKQTYPQFSGFFKKGDILDLEIVRYQEDTVIVNEVYGAFNSKGELLGIVSGGHLQYLKSKGDLPNNFKKLSDPQIAPKGSYKGYRLINGQGRAIDDGVVLNAVGYKTLKDLFDKV